MTKQSNQFSTMLTRKKTLLFLSLVALVISLHGQSIEITNPIPEPYDLSSVVYAGLPEEFTLETGITPEGITFSTDGTRMYIIERSNESVQEYLLSTPYDVSTASFTHDFSISSEEGSPRDMAFNNDGTKMFIVGYDNGVVVEYSLSTAYDISTATYAGAEEEFVINPSPTLTWFEALQFSANGEKLFLINNFDDRITAYNLSTAYDVSTAIFADEELFIRNMETDAGSVVFDNTGTKMFIVGRGSDAIQLFQLDIAYDISTATYIQQLSIRSEETSPVGLAFNPDGSKLFITGWSRNVAEYDIAASVDYPENGTGIVINVDAIDGQGGANDEGISYSLEGTDAALFSISTNGQISFIASPDFEIPQDQNSNNIYELTVTASHEGEQSKQIITVTVKNVNDSPDFTNFNTSDIDYSGAEYTGLANEFPIKETIVLGLEFNNNGTRMYTIGSGTGRIIEYELEEPYKVSTAVYAGVEEELSIFEEDILPTGLSFSNDGSRMFIIGDQDDAIVEYHLSVPFDVSTATYAGIEEEFFVGTEDDRPSAIAFNPDGTRLYIGGGRNRSVVEYTLTSAFDVSTATHSNTFPIGISIPQDIEFTPDGMKMILMISGRVHFYTLNAPYDISSNRLVSSFNTTGAERNATALALNPDGGNLFVTGWQDDAIVEYRFPSVLSTIENSTATVFDVDANDGQGGTNDASVAYSLTGPDAGVLAIDGAGLITFNSPPNFEDPIDGDRDGIYEVSVVATSSDNAARRPVFISVEDVNDSPEFTFVGEGSFDIKNAAHTGRWEEFDLGTFNVEGIQFNSDGSRVFILDVGSDDKITQYELQSSYDVSTVDLTIAPKEILVNAEENSPRSFAFSTDGTRIFVIGTSDDSVVEYHLSTPYDVTTASYAGPEEEFSVASESGGPVGITFSADGTRMFILDAGIDGILTYSLSTAFDVSTASYAGEVEGFSVADRHLTPVGLKFNNDGTKLFVVGSFRDKVSSYILQAPYDISSAIFSEELRINNEENNPSDLAFSSDGSKMFLIGRSNASIVEYRLPSKIQYEEGDTDDLINIDANDGEGGANDNVTYSLSGDDASQFSIDESGIITFNAVPDFEDPQDVNGDNQYDIQVIASNTIDQVSQGIVITVQNVDDTPVFTHVGNGSYDASFGIYSGLANDFQLTHAPSGVTFNHDGTKFFTISPFDGLIKEYELTTSYDLSSATYAGRAEDFSVANEEEQPNAITFNPAGTRMFIVGTRGLSVVEYHLSTPFDVSTAVHAGEEDELPISSQVSNPTGLAFSQEGTRMFIIGRNNRTVFRYVLTTAFDISTASYLPEGGAFDIDDLHVWPEDIRFNPEGTTLYVVDSFWDRITQYQLSAPFDISAPVFDGLFNFGSESEEPRGLAFDEDGSRLLLADASKRAILSYRLTSDIDYDEGNVIPALDIDANDGQGGANDDIAYTLVGDDASILSIDGSGIISFNTAPDFENPEDNDGNNVYEFNVVIDNGIEEAVQPVRINIIDLDFSIISPAEVEVAENTTEVIYTIVVNEATGVRLGTARDEDLFSLNGNEISFLSAPDFEVPEDDDTDNEYQIEVIADDGLGGSISLEVTIRVTDVDEIPPVITSPISAEVQENSVFNIYTATANETVTFTLGSLKDEALFNIEEGELSFIDAPDFENPQDGNADNSYQLDLIATDEAGNVSSIELTIIITDQGDEIAPVITSASEAPVVENTTSSFYTIQADEPVTFSLGTTKDEEFFTLEIDEIRFTEAPDYENPQDENEDNIYQVDLIATDLAGNQTTKLLEINVTDVDDTPPVISSPVSISVLENITGVIYTAIADETATYTLGSTKDESLFMLDGDEISFIASPDFEDPQDLDEDNIYRIDLVATDEAGNSSTTEISITVTDVDEIAPTITSPTAVSIEENSTGVFYEATADEQATFTLGGTTEEVAFILSGTKDDNLFSLVDDEISFITSPDFEDPQDADENNIYLIDLIATDEAGNSTTLEVSITVTDVDDTPPMITSPSAISVVENTSGTVYLAEADETVTYRLGASRPSEVSLLDVNNDDGLFVIENGNEIRFVNPPDFENPQDYDNDNVYLINLIATDEARNSTTLEVSITVTDADEIAPTITSATAISIDENSSGSIYTATADEAVVFSLGLRNPEAVVALASGQKDESLFNLEDDQISFITPPDFEDPQDLDRDNIYRIDLVATDEAGNSSFIEVAITVTDVDDIAPTITSPSEVSVEENFTGEFYVAEADESVAFSLGNSKDESLFELTSNEISFISPPDFENPQDADGNNVYLIDLIATDEAGNSTTVEISVTVTEVDEIAPVITSPSAISVVENTSGTVYLAEADEAVTFQLGRSFLIESAPTQGFDKDEDLFNLDGNEISFITAPDFENPQDLDGDNVYQIDLVATDEAGNETTLEVSITVTDADEIAPIITSSSSVIVEENINGSVYTASADEAVTFSLGLDRDPEEVVTLASGLKDEDLFDLEGDQISFITPPDFEDPQDLDGDNIYRIDLVATDEAGNFSSIEVAITVTDVDEINPIITSASSLNVEENFDGIVYTATADETVTFSLGQAKDESRFLINDNSISFLTSPDFENPRDGNQDNVYIIDLIATDLAGNESTLEVTITVTDVEDGTPPSITSPSSVVIDENLTGTIYTASADETVTFSLGGLKDEALFILNGDGISFINAPDFENPQDANGDNTYLIDLTAVNESGNSATLEVSIAVQDVDEVNPVITSPSILTIEENVSGRIYTATANETVVFSLGSNKDEALFLISENLIAFANAPDFENPLDQDEDNVYLIDLVATDEAGNVGTLEVAITVTDVDDQVLSAVDEVTLSFYPNPASEWVTVEGPELIDRVSFFDLNGKRLIEQEVRKIKTRIDVSGLPAGLYLIIVDINGRKTEERFIKK